MVRVSVEVRGGDDLFEVAVHADSISRAVDVARERFPGCDVRVMFPIDGGEFFAGPEGSGTGDGGRAVLMPDRVS